MRSTNFGRNLRHLWSKNIYDRYYAIIQKLVLMVQNFHDIEKNVVLMDKM